MSTVFVWVRYVLILGPAIATMYVERLDSYGWYVFCVLALLSLVELRRNTANTPAAFVLLAAELILSGWMCLTFHGILYLLYFSALLSVSSPSQRTACFIIGIVGLNAVITENSPGAIIGANLLFITVGVTLYYLHSYRHAQQEMGMLNDELRRKNYQLDETQKQLLDYAKKVENAAQLEERNRISRDIHDELGHKLIRLKLMMDAVVLIVPVQPDKGLEMAETVRGQLAESMDMLRATVRNIKPKDAVLRAYSLENLVQELKKDGNLNVLFEIAGLPYPLYPSLEVSLYRNAQEAITNAVRHGAASQIAIHVTYEPHQVTMEVSNNGMLPGSIERLGLGLSGMEARTAMLGGTFRIETQFPFTVRTCLPTGQS